MKAGVIRGAARPSVPTPENCDITELMNLAEEPAVSLARAAVAPGASTRWHRLHGVDERYVILAGAGEVEVGDDPATRVGPGDVVLIPRGARQRIRNTGAGELVFDCICTPRFIPDCYEALE